LKAARELVLELMSIPGPSGQEKAVAHAIRNKLLAARVPAEAIRFDNVHRQSPLGGEIGNLICRLPGTVRGPRRMLMAHIDTVPLCVGSRPRLKKRHVESGHPASALGADDRSGAAVLLNTVREIMQRTLPHPPLTFLWAVQEEVGLIGARFVPLAALGRPHLVFNWDGGSADKVTIGATGAYRMMIKVEGIASHAGAAPEAGVSAVAIAGLAIGQLQRDGWLGDVRQGNLRGTSNLGYIRGGGATNVVPDSVEIRGECRSHDRDFRGKILATIEQAFRKAAQQVCNNEQRSGKVIFEATEAYESFLLPRDEPCVTQAAAAVRAVHREPNLVISNGGLDANWLTARGLPTVTLGCGQRNIHMLTEQLDLNDFEDACRMALRLATASI
jgi:tripeptide aminopeptidase